MKRIALFLLTNLAVVLVLGIVLSIVFSVTGMSSRSVGGILVLATVFGFGGSLISLALSKWMAKKSTGAIVINNPQTNRERWLLSTVEQQSTRAGIKMPEVAIYPAQDMNAFATGMTKNSSLVAVSAGLLDQMTQDEAEAVIAHEISHIANGDMVTLALIQGVVNTFVIFLARIIGGFIDNAMRGDDDESTGHGFSYFIIVFILEMVFGILASTIVMYYARKREYVADSGSAALVGKQKMIAALEKLKSSSDPQLEGSLMAFGITGKHKTSLFMSHPPLEARIEALQNSQMM